MLMSYETNALSTNCKYMNIYFLNPLFAIYTLFKVAQHHSVSSATSYDAEACLKQFLSLHLTHF